MFFMWKPMKTQWIWRDQNHPVNNQRHQINHQIPPFNPFPPIQIQPTKQLCGKICIKLSISLHGFQYRPVARDYPDITALSPKKWLMNGCSSTCGSIGLTHGIPWSFWTSLAPENSVEGFAPGWSLHWLPPGEENTPQHFSKLCSGSRWCREMLRFRQIHLHMFNDITHDGSMYGIYIYIYANIWGILMVYWW